AGRGGRDLTRGSIVGALVALAVPISLANVLQTVYQLTDTFWLGRIGAAAVAAVSLSFPVIFVLISLGGGLSVAGAILVAQYRGRGDQAAVDHVASQTLLAIVAVAIALSVVGYTGAGAIMRLMGARGAVLDGAVAYLEVSFLGLTFLFVYFVFQSLMRGVGDVLTPFVIVLVTVLLNFAADPLFILGWGPIPAMGVAGAAAATVLTQGIAAVIGLVLLFSGKQAIRLRARDLAGLDIPLLGRMVRLGAPAALEQTTRGLGFAVMATLVAAYPTVTIAAYGIGSRILSFFVIPALGLSMATSTLVSQNIGAGKTDRVDATARLSLLVAFLVLGAAGLLVLPFAGPIVGAFIRDDPAVVAEGAHFLRILAWSFGFLGFSITIGGIFRGAGNTMLALVMTVLSVWVFLFPVAWVLSFRTPLAADGIWWAHPTSYVLTALTGGAWLLFGRWKKPALTGDEALAEEVTQEAIVEEGIG
ncbi:MAG: MATE family efflux transporter, partial [Gemmatimonadota bacterium]